MLPASVSLSHYMTPQIGTERRAIRTLLMKSSKCFSSEVILLFAILNENFLENTPKEACTTLNRVADTFVVLVAKKTAIASRNPEGRRS